MLKEDSIDNRYSKILNAEEQRLETLNKWKVLNIKIGLVIFWIISMFLLILSSIIIGLYIADDNSALLATMTISLFGICFLTMIIGVPLCIKQEMDERTLFTFGIVFTLFLICGPGSMLAVVNDLYSPPNHLREWKRLATGTTLNISLDTNLTFSHDYTFYNLNDILPLPNSSFSKPVFFGRTSCVRDSCDLFCAVPLVNRSYIKNVTKLDVWLSCAHFHHFGASSTCNDALSDQCIQNILSLKPGQSTFGIALNQIEYDDHRYGIEASGLASSYPIILTPSSEEEKDQFVDYLYKSNVSLLAGVWCSVLVLSVIVVVVYLHTSRKNCKMDANIK